MRWINPPAGGKYGFPKPFDPAPGQSIEDWLRADGYPQSEIDQWNGAPCKIWGEPEKDPVRLFEAKVLAQASHMAGDRAKAEKWYRSEPIPALGDRTAKELVESGEGESVLELLRHVAWGGFA